MHISEQLRCTLLCSLLRQKRATEIEAGPKSDAQEAEYIEMSLEDSLSCAV